MARVSRFVFAVVFFLLLVLTFGAGWVVARLGIGARVDPGSLPAHEREFVERMRGVTMSGRFTVAGREDRPPRPDRYDIASVEKVGDDRWRFNARIRYGDTDVTLPVVVPMQWIGDTPVIMLTDFAIPTMGTFTVRLFFHGDRYAGTWQHGAVGGHMFGRIEKSSAAGS